MGFLRGNFIALLLFLLQSPFWVYGATQSYNCEDFVTYMTQFDAHLGHRKEFASDLVSKNVTGQKFVDSMNDLKEGGKNYACGLTRYWIDNVFLGSERLFEELRRSKLGYGIEAGFYDAVDGNKIQSVISSYSDLKDNYVLYRFQTDDVVDHVWIVVQKPGPEYKIYQSYNMAYSSHAWTAKSDSLDKMWKQGQIRYWDDVLIKVKAFLESVGGSISADGSITYPPNLIQPAKDWVAYVVNYNKTLIINNFKKAFDRFGQNKWIPKDSFMNDYVIPLQKTMQTVKSYIGTNKTWTDDVHQNWISLFGSPVPTIFPGIPFDFIPIFTANKKMELQVRVEVINQLSNKCYENFKLIGRHVPGWSNPFNGSIKTCSSFSLLSLMMFFLSAKLVFY